MNRFTAALTPLFFLAGAQAAEVPTDAWDVEPLLPGVTAPAFTTTDARGERYTFDPEDRERGAIVIFYRGGWCPYCNLYLAELRKAEDALLALDLELIFLSGDSAEMLAEAMADADDVPNYTLLSDASSQIAQAFGVAFTVDDATVEKYKDYGIDLEKASGGFTHHNLPAPATFVINAEGKVVFTHVNPDYKVRLHPDVLVAAARTMPDYVMKR